MSEETSLPLDLKFLPDWLKETPGANPYAKFQGESPRDDRRGPRRDGQGFARRDGGGGGGFRQGPRNDDRGPRREGGPGGPRRDGGPRGDRNQRGGDRRDQRSFAPRPELPRVLPAEVHVEILPTEPAAEAIAKQIRTSGKAYPLHSTARLFLDKPERHKVRISSKSDEHPLYQIEDGPISFDRNLIERNAFRLMKARFYREEQTEIEPPKGNFTNVAKCRSTGTILGPTSHHGYQVAVKKLYEERFSRQMSYQTYLREEIEIVTGEQAVNDWKESAKFITVYHTTTEEEPVSFKTPAEVEAHFRKTYLPNLIRSAKRLECGGATARSTPERLLVQRIRETFDRQRAYPDQLVNGLRSALASQNLQIFKHRKRVLFVSAIRPVVAASTEGMAEGPAAILTTVRENPRITKPDLAKRIHGEALDGETGSTLKAQLAADLHYLSQSGTVIEFADGTLDLALTPRDAEKDKPQDSPESAPAQTETDAPAESCEIAPTDACELPAQTCEITPADACELPAQACEITPADACELPAQACEIAPADACELPAQACEIAPADACELPDQACEIAPADACELPPNETSA